MASKYDALAHYLLKHPGPTHSMSFGQIEVIIGSDLPDSARSRREWWGNARSQHNQHVQAKNGWLAAGWVVDLGGVDLMREIVTFRRTS